MIMGGSGTSDMYQVPQVLALEIRVDRVEIMKKMGKDYDLEDTVIWLQILDLPCMEMLPYQRDRLQATSVESLDSQETLNPESSLLHQSAVKINKKSSGLFVGEPVVNRSDTVEPAAAKKTREKKKLSVKNDPIKPKRKSRKSEDMKSHKSTSKIVVQDLTKKDADRPRTSSKTLSFKVSDLKKDIQQDDQSASQLYESMKSKEALLSTKDANKEVESQRNIRMLGRLLAGTKEELPEGIAFNSDCCVILPCSSASEMIYKMERMPLIMYLVKVKPCNKLIGKVCIRLDQCYQNAVIKAAKVQGAVVSYVLQESFPIFDVDECNKCSTGWIQGSVKLVSYGQYGLTELKSSTGDLMTGRLREYRNNLKDSSKALQVLEVEEGPSNPYGLKPVITRDSRPPPQGYKCPSKEPFHSIFDFVQTFHKPPEKHPEFEFII